MNVHVNLCMFLLNYSPGNGKVLPIRVIKLNFAKKNYHTDCSGCHVGPRPRERPADGAVVVVSSSADKGETTGRGWGRVAGQHFRFT